MSHSTTRPLTAEIRESNARLDDCLRKKYGVGVQTYKIIKAIAQLLGAAAGIYAISQGADPMSAYTLIAAIIAGPEMAEAILTNQSE